MLEGSRSNARRPLSTAAAQVHEEAPTPTRDEFLDANALASLLGLDARSVRRIHLDGRMPSAVRIGSALRWRKSDIDAWLANGGGER